MCLYTSRISNCQGSLAFTIYLIHLHGFSGKNILFQALFYLSWTPVVTEFCLVVIRNNVIDIHWSVMSKCVFNLEGEL